MSGERRLYSLDDDGWDESRKRWAVGAALPLVAADATHAEASLPWGSREDWPASVHEAAQRLDRFLTEEERASRCFSIGRLSIDDEQMRQDFVTVAPFSYSVALWRDGERLAHVTDSCLVIALTDGECTHLSEAVGPSRVMELQQMLIESIRSREVHSFRFQHGIESIGPTERQCLLELTKDEDPSVRARVTMDLVFITDCDEPDEDIVRRLAELTTDADLRVRDHACFVLGTQMRNVDTPEIREALYARLEDIDTDARCEALVGLAYRRDPRVLPFVRAALSRDDVWRLELIAAAALGDPSLHPLVLGHQIGWSDPDSVRIADLARRLTDPDGFGDDLLSGLVESLRGPDRHGAQAGEDIWWHTAYEAMEIAPYRSRELYEALAQRLQNDVAALARLDATGTAPS